jgi:hypothetical protein
LNIAPLPKKATDFMTKNLQIFFISVGYSKNIFVLKVLQRDSQFQQPLIIFVVKFWAKTA